MRVSFDEWVQDAGRELSSAPFAGPSTAARLNCGQTPIHRQIGVWPQYDAWPKLVLQGIPETRQARKRRWHRWARGPSLAQPLETENERTTETARQRKTRAA